MSNEDVNRPEDQPEIVKPEPVQADKRSRRTLVIGASALVGLLLIGVIAGAVMKCGRHDERQALLPPTLINAMTDDSLVAVKGKVVEMFGTKFIIADTTGRALIDTGPPSNKMLVAQNEEVTVQGRFDGGFVRARLVIHADGRVDELGSSHRHGRRKGWDGPDGHGPHRD